MLSRASAERGSEVELEAIGFEETQRQGSFKINKTESTSSGATELGVNESYHRAPCKRFCGTLCITGPPEDGIDLQKIFIPLYLIVLIVYSSVAGAFLRGHYGGLVAVPALYIAMALLAYLFCAYTEPGVVPPKVDFEDPHVSPDIRVCRKCNLVLDMETRHCTYCNACIRELDHHCGVTGNCVGARNKLHFTFMMFYNVASFWVVAIGLVYAISCHVLREQENFNGTFPTALDVTAKLCIALMVIILVVSQIIYFLAFFGKLGRFAPAIYRYACCNPLARGSSNMLVTLLDREPLCCPNTAFGRFFTVPKREFYPDDLT